ncbi:hypothetical protein BO71DRAFT_395771 [Aspergillus ellipticus CBS 707.79]|uniref:LysM domain-containing protein n=1 Tax=Aspergillus ellipticus CBS 707.79 TaxID=1448320 RepID=A0A319DKN5_9EURO|nr:hypothetical protein BO71DRAFT_395771 [Aspergillus ellipticus CBS 707.79]
MWALPQSLLVAITLFLVSTPFTQATSASCNSSALNTTYSTYPITVEGTTVFDVAKATNRGVCDIGRHNLMADVTIIPAVGETFIIPPEVCDPDSETCLLPNTTRTRTCINGGPRLYYTVNGDTYDIVAQRLNISTEALMGNYSHGMSATDTLHAGQFLKVPKDLADKYDTTVGQLMMLSPTYNYSSIAFFPGGTFPPINIAINCTALSDNISVID